MSKQSKKNKAPKGPKPAKEPEKKPVQEPEKKPQEMIRPAAEEAKQPPRQPNPGIRVIAWLWYRRWVAAVVAFALVFLTVLTLVSRSAVQEHREEAQELACARVMPQATTFSETPYQHELALTIYAGYSGSTVVGHCVETQVDGFGGAMTLLVGVDTDGRVTGVVIEDNQEDPDWVEQANSAEHMQQYIGRSGTIRSWAIQGVTGATETSRAVTEGVNQALKAVAEMDTEGGEVFVEEE